MDVTHSSIASILTRLELAANIVEFEPMAARGNAYAAECVAFWKSMLG